jgi:hypothetical protein
MTRPTCYMECRRSPTFWGAKRSVAYHLAATQRIPTFKMNGQNGVHPSIKDLRRA